MTTIPTVLLAVAFLAPARPSLALLSAWSTSRLFRLYPHVFEGWADKEGHEPAPVTGCAAAPFKAQAVQTCNALQC